MIINLPEIKKWPAAVKKNKNKPGYMVGEIVSEFDGKNIGASMSMKTLVGK